MGGIGMDVPVQMKPGLILHCDPIAPVTNRVVMGDDVHFRQNPDGRFIVGEIFSRDLADGVDVDELSTDIIARLHAQLRGARPKLARICQGHRPVPQD
ncbi:MAG: hypothetical protein ACPGRD_04895 [Planktomarina sp.]